MEETKFLFLIWGGEWHPLRMNKADPLLGGLFLLTLTSQDNHISTRLNLGEQGGSLALSCLGYVGIFRG